VSILMKVSAPLTRITVLTINQKLSQPLCKSTVQSANRLDNTQTDQPAVSCNSSVRCDGKTGIRNDSSGLNIPASKIQRIPELNNQLRKGQKVPLTFGTAPLGMVKAGFGWNVQNPECDMDVSAFLLCSSGKVPTDDWFVFYGQTKSPDNSILLSTDSAGKDREMISVDFTRLSKNITKIVFVLTIHEAFERSLNFSMIRDAYIRITAGNTESTVFSFKMDEYYPNVTSMTIGEFYLHNNQWKFNPVGNGINKDLAGQCAVYGVSLE